MAFEYNWSKVRVQNLKKWNERTLLIKTHFWFFKIVLFSATDYPVKHCTLFTQNTWILCRISEFYFTFCFLKWKFLPIFIGPNYKNIISYPDIHYVIKKN